MNIHEYQGKSVLKKYGVRIQEGLVADTPDKAVEVARELSQQTGTKWYVVKSQNNAELLLLNLLKTYARYPTTFLGKYLLRTRQARQENV
jgi:hypothetical protein